MATPTLKVAKVSDRRFMVPSRSHPGELRVVVRLADGSLQCDCPGCVYRGTCAHNTAVEASLEPPRKRPDPALGIAILTGRDPKYAA